MIVQRILRQKSFSPRLRVSLGENFSFFYIFLDPCLGLCAREATCTAHQRNIINWRSWDDENFVLLLSLCPFFYALYTHFSFSLPTHNRECEDHESTASSRDTKKNLFALVRSHFIHEKRVEITYGNSWAFHEFGRRWDRDRCCRGCEAPETERTQSPDLMFRQSWWCCRRVFDILVSDPRSARKFLPHLPLDYCKDLRKKVAGKYWHNVISWREGNLSNVYMKC